MPSQRRGGVANDVHLPLAIREDVARALSYSPSTISQQLAALEKEVGVKLHTPVGCRIRLTREGELLAAHAATLPAGAERAEAELRACLTNPKGSINVAVFQTAALALAPEMLSYVRDNWPHLHVRIAEIQPDGAIGALLAHDFDLVVGGEYPGHPAERHPGVLLTEVARDSLRIVRPAHSTTSASVATMADLDWVMEPARNAARDWAVATCREACALLATNLVP